ncbi:hypothetical protein Pint_10301 [Pistacia integerrima]|uniref:Uncharacterized protein n=1 Tax=Pistacia integerrima TaxID=434235 RepID=A0ACC0XDY6_9ROSI|nr:hypothetical protein Pint_10301 [Pistacia integerrima]
MCLYVVRGCFGCELMFAIGRSGFLILVFLYRPLLLGVMRDSLVRAATIFVVGREDVDSCLLGCGDDKFSH